MTCRVRCVSIAMLFYTKLLLHQRLTTPLVMCTNLYSAHWDASAASSIRIIRQAIIPTTFLTVHICAAVFSKTNIGVFLMYFSEGFFSAVQCQAAVLGSQVFYGTSPASEEKDNVWEWESGPHCPNLTSIPTVWITLVVWRRNKGNKTQRVGFCLRELRSLPDVAASNKNKGFIH